MTVSINERLKAIRTALKLSQRDIAKELHTAQSVYARMETGINPIHARTVELLCYRFNVNRAYLRDGLDEPMFCEVPADAKLSQLYDIFEELNGLFQDYLIVQAKELLRVQNKQDTLGQNTESRKSNM